MDRPAIIPDNVSFQEAVVAYLACVAKKGVDMVGIDPGDTVLVTGAGNIGLSAVQLAKIYGAEKVIAADVRESRLGVAENFTPNTLDLSQPDKVERLLDMNDGKKVDVAIECSGNPAAINPLPDYVRAGGRIHLQGQYREPILITDYARWNCSDLTITCSIAFNPGDKEEVLGFISDGKFDAEGLYTKEYAIDDAPKAYKEVEEKRYRILKTLFKWED
jgi:2-desacetyl-2-hydroxyethyl bacteriochlorophyllide A dehydrogenase